MADQPKQQPGLKLPTPGGDAPPPAPPTSKGTPAAATEVPSSPPVEAETAARDTAIAGGILLVLMIGLLFVKNAWTVSRVGKKVPPRSANMSGWWLFIALSSVLAVVVMGFANPPRFMTILFVAPLVVLALISAVLTFVSSRR